MQNASLQIGLLDLSKKEFKEKVSVEVPLASRIMVFIVGTQIPII